VEKDERIVDSNLMIFHLLSVVVVVVVFGIAVVVADLYEYTLRRQILVLYSFFWVIPRHLNFMYRRFGTLCSIFIGPMDTTYKDGTECYATSAHKIQTPGDHPEERIQHSQHG
jgi:hypothetical protein